MKKSKILIFIIILLIGVFLRLYRIDNIPPSLNWDEVSLGYNAYSILKTGKDEWGQIMPLSFRAYGDYKLPLYIYLDVPLIALFGLNEISIRMLSALSGVGIVILIFFITWELTKNTYLAFWGMLISAIVPWLMTFSRIGLEANLALFLTTTSFYLFLLSQRKRKLLYLSILFLGLSAFAYNSSRVIILPLILLAAIFFPYPLFKRRELLISLVILLIFVSVAFYQAVTVDSGARFRWTTILDEGAITKINQLRGSSKAPHVLNQFVYNKATYFISEASKNYLSHFDPNFLFIKGGSNFQFSTQGTGQLYLVMLPLVLAGIWQIIRQRKNWQLFILGWLLVAPIPGAITRDAPHSLRTIFLIIPLIISAVLGIEWIKGNLPTKFSHSLTIVIIAILLGNTYLFWQNYAGEYRNKFSWVWQYGYKQAIEFVKDNQDRYTSVIFTKKYGEPHEFLLFYLNYDPSKYQNNENLLRYGRSDWFWVDKFDKYEFINDWEIKDKISGMKNTLLITSPQNIPENSQILTTINFLDGEKAFEIVEVN